MALFTEGKNIGDWFVSESDQIDFSRENATLAITAVELINGTVLGQVTATGVYAPLAPAANDGTEIAAAVLIYNATISAATTKAAVFVRDMEYKEDGLTWPAGITADQKKAAVASLKSKGIVKREVV